MEEISSAQQGPCQISMDLCEDGDTRTFYSGIIPTSKTPSPATFTDSSPLPSV